MDTNGAKLRSILRAIIFCGTHDFPLRGHLSHEGNFEDLLHFRITAGNYALEDHFMTLMERKVYIPQHTD